MPSYVYPTSAQLTQIRAVCPDQAMWSFSSQQATLRRLNKAFDGFFRRVVTHKMVTGPIVITCTTNDKAVGKMYPLASLLAGQDAAGLFDKQSRFGGLGCHGAQMTPEARDGTLLDMVGTYQFEAGKLYNLNADGIILGHSDICKNPVVYAMLHAVATT